MPPNASFSWETSNLTRETVITDTFEATPNVVLFFKKQTDSRFKINVEFCKWLAVNAGKTLGQAVLEYKAMKTRNSYKFYSDKIKKAQPVFDATQSYALAFLRDNPELTMADVRRVPIKKGQTQPYDLWDVYARSDLDL